MIRMILMLVVMEILRDEQKKMFKDKILLHLFHVTRKLSNDIDMSLISSAFRWSKLSKRIGLLSQAWE